MLDEMLSEAGISRAELSRMTGISRSTMRRWEGRTESQVRARGIPGSVSAFVRTLAERNRLAARVEELERVIKEASRVVAG